MATPPLNQAVAIVDDKGRPTPDFIRWWEQQRATNDTITPIATATEVGALLDKIGSTQGMVLYRDSGNWNVLAPGIAGRVLTTGGGGANPSWAVAGASTFTGLTDTPANYTGAAGKLVAVNAGGTGLEYVVGGGGGSSLPTNASFAPITDATSWVSDGDFNLRADPSTVFQEDNAAGFIAYTTSTGAAVGGRLRSPTKKPVAGADFDFVFRMDMVFARSFPSFQGVFFQNGLTGNAVMFGVFQTDARFYRQRFANLTFNSEVDITAGTINNWNYRGYLRVTRAGDTLTYLSSVNGINWITHATESVAAWVGNVSECGLWTRRAGQPLGCTLWGLNDNGPQPPG